MKPLLLVDDSYTVRTELRAELVASGFVVTVCDSLASARRALRAHAYSLVILDVLLPDGSGIDLLREIKSAKDKKPPPVLLLSSSSASPRARTPTSVSRSTGTT
jgi:DNA-binding response OmpR family regulator